MGSGIDLHSAHLISAHLVYDGSGLNVTLTDALSHAAWGHTLSVDIPAAVGGKTAYIGFTGGTGSKAVVGQILDWTSPTPDNALNGTGVAQRENSTKRRRTREQARELLAVPDRSTLK